jgi:FMN reductase
MHIVGLGGTLTPRSANLLALDYALKAAEAAGASVELLSLYDLDLPMYAPGKPLDECGLSVRKLIDATRQAHGMIWATAAYHGTLAGVTKNALDYLEFLAKDPEPYLYNKVIGLIATSGGEMAAVNSINTMVQIVHALRGTAAPLMVPIAKPRLFDENGQITDEKIGSRLTRLGNLVFETACRFQREDDSRTHEFMF